MGNCCRTTSSVDWAGDDWGSMTSKHKRSTSTRSSKVFDEAHTRDDVVVLEKKQLLGVLGASSETNGKVKIKISKKELKELMGGIEKTKREGRRASAEQVLVRLLSARDHHAHHGPWRPVLQSIPEVN